MRRTFSKAVAASKAIKELGLVPVGQYIAYKIGLQTGWIRWRTHKALERANRIPPGLLSQNLINLPDQEKILSELTEEAKNQLFAEADEICAGHCRIYSAETVPIIPGSLEKRVDWTACKSLGLNEDVKIIWEPGRFGWVFKLSMAYLFSRNEKYALAFWDLCERFFETNPPYFGWQWVSGQEVALRLISLVYASQVFAGSEPTTSAREKKLAYWISVHAARIPPTLVYARSQNNNHLLSEACGLFTAGLALPQHPDSEQWKSTGWYWFAYGLEQQISPKGIYIQHSTNYHRLMLQLVIWMDLIRRPQGYEWSKNVRQLIEASGRWLAALLDPNSGQVPNLGPNDGAYILPFTQAGFRDYRPVLQAFWRLFFQHSLLPSGEWDDFSWWMGINTPVESGQDTRKAVDSEPLTLHHPELDSWGYLRTAKFTSRPGHADLLHLDLWWRGVNVAQDAGTYRYNDSSPWDNSLTHTAVHNTLSCVHNEQMQRVGRFLYLDWARASIIAVPNPASPTIRAVHDGYKSRGWLHQRSLVALPRGWQVVDQVIPELVHSETDSLEFRLHWLLLDCPFKILQNPAGSSFGLQLDTTAGPLQLQVQINSDISSTPSFTLARAGILLFGAAPVSPTWGWVSPTYNQKEPALSFSIQIKADPPLTFVTNWLLGLN